MAIYRTGTASLAANGVVIGVGTKWQDKLSLIRVGATIMFPTVVGAIGTISAIVSDTELRVMTTNGVVVPDGSEYVILLHDSITVDGLAQDVAETLRYYQSKETEISDALDFFRTFDWEAFKVMVDQVAANTAETEASKNAAKVSEDNAKASETNAKSSENSASDSKIAAAASEMNAKTSETNAKTSENNAKTSETNAANSAAAALASQNAAKESETNAKASETNAANSEIAALSSRNDAEYFRNATATMRDETQASQVAAKTSETNAKTSETNSKTSENNAKQSEINAEQWAQSVNADNLLTKSGNLTGLADVKASRTNIELGEGSEPIFKGTIAVKSATDTESAQGGMFKSKLKNSNGEDVVTTQSYAETQLGTGKHTIGVITPSRSHYFQLDVEGNFNGFNRLSSQPGGELLLEGVDDNTVQVISHNPANANDYTGHTRYNWHGSTVITGPIRQGGTGLENYTIYVLNAGVSDYAFKFRPDGKMSSRRFVAEGFQAGWDQPNNYGDSGVWLSDVGNNDGGWVPAISWQSQSTGGYPIRATLGLISQGAANWPRAALRCRGDGENWTNFEFVVNSCDIQASGTFGAFTFQKAPTSDRDLKHDIVYTDGKESYDRVMQWLPTMFKYNGSEIQRYGLIAQDLVGVDPQYVKIIPGSLKNPDLVGTDGFKAEDGEYYDDTLALDSNVMITDLACAFVYNSNKVSDLEKEVAELKEIVSKLISK